MLGRCSICNDTIVLSVVSWFFLQSHVFEVRKVILWWLLHLYLQRAAKSKGGGLLRSRYALIRLFFVSCGPFMHRWVYVLRGGTRASARIEAALQAALQGKLSYTAFRGGGASVVVAAGSAVVVVEASALKVYPRVTLARASTFSGSVVRTLRGEEGLPKMFCLVASNLGHLRSKCSIVCGSSLQRGHMRPAEGPRRLT